MNKALDHFGIITPWYKSVGQIDKDSVFGVFVKVNRNCSRTPFALTHRAASVLMHSRKLTCWVCIPIFLTLVRQRAHGERQEKGQNNTHISSHLMPPNNRFLTVFDRKLPKKNPGKCGPKLWEVKRIRLLREMHSTSKTHALNRIPEL